jgi:hypothetical protein
MMALMDIFVGVPQSKYAGAAILLSLLVVSGAILIGRDALPLSQKFAFILLIFLVSLPGLLMTLFQLTCLVTGSNNGKSWWCGAYSWFISALLIIYSVLLVTIAVLSLASSGKVLDDITRADMEYFNSSAVSAQHAAIAMFDDKQPSTAQPVAPATAVQPVAHDPMAPHAPMAAAEPASAPMAPEAFYAPVQGAASLPADVAAFDTKSEHFQAYEGFEDAKKKHD